MNILFTCYCKVRTQTLVFSQSLYFFSAEYMHRYYKLFLYSQLISFHYNFCITVPFFSTVVSLDVWHRGYYCIIILIFPVLVLIHTARQTELNRTCSTWETNLGYGWFRSACLSTQCECFHFITHVCFPNGICSV